MEYVNGDYLKPDWKGQPDKREHLRHKESIGIWIKDKHIYFKPINDDILRGKIIVDRRHNSVSLANTKGNVALEAYQVMLVDGVIKVPTRIVRARQRDKEYFIAPCMLILESPMYDKTFDSNYNMTTPKLVIDKKYIP